MVTLTPSSTNVYGHIGPIDGKKPIVLFFSAVYASAKSNLYAATDTEKLNDCKPLWDLTSKRDVARKFWWDIEDEYTALFYLVGTRMYQAAF